MNNFWPTEAASQVSLFAILATIMVATVSGCWSVWVRAEENKRAEWRRIQELIQIVHNGSSTGKWAQKLAIIELASLWRRRSDIKLILTEAEQFWRALGIHDLADHIQAVTRTL